ncbi:MAG: lipid II:glycine glycyltransferase FemX [Oscillochloridaceae bacterium umkhey_bin13]
MTAVPASAPSDQVGTFALIEPDPRSWDAFVANHPQGNLLQQAGWGELKTRFGWQARILAVANPTGLVAGALMLSRGRYGFTVAYCPRGPLLADDPAANQVLLAGLSRLAQRQRAIFLRLEPGLAETAPTAANLHTWLLLQGLQPAATIQPRSTLLVDLTPPEPKLLAACSKGHRADMRRAERNGVSIRVGSEADLGAFYQLMLTTGQRAGFAIHNEAYYRAVWQIFQPRARLLLAELEGELVAAHLICADAQAGRYLYSGANDAGLRAGANHLLGWEALRWARELGCHSYDLWGMPDALGRAASAPDEATRTTLEAEAQADPLVGVYRFKKGFGGRVTRLLPAYDRVLLAPLYQLALRRMQL